MKKTKTFEVDYNYFEPGTKVTPTSNRCPLVMGQIYTVTKCSEPMFAGEDAVCFVKGRTIGVSTTYLREVEDRLS